MFTIHDSGNTLDLVELSFWQRGKERPGRKPISPPARIVGSELEDLFTDPDWMRRGIATALVRDLAATVPRIYLTANPHALAFYESVGFVEDGIAETSGGPAVRMHRDG